jgi:hypothetical protein
VAIFEILKSGAKNSSIVSDEKLGSPASVVVDMHKIRRVKKLNTIKNKLMVFMIIEVK